MKRGARDLYRAEKRYLRADGSAVWATASLSVLRGPSGEPQQFISQVGRRLRAAGRRGRPRGQRAALPVARRVVADRDLRVLASRRHDLRQRPLRRAVRAGRRRARGARLAAAHPPRGPVGARWTGPSRPRRWNNPSMPRPACCVAPATSAGCGCRVAPVAEDDGGPLQYVGTIEDVTDHRQALGRAHPPRAARRADRPAEPRAVPRPARRRRSPGRAARGTAVARALPRPRPLQGRQRLARPRGRRPAARRRRRPRLQRRRCARRTRVARFGGDEFTVLLRGPRRASEDAAAVAERLLRAASASRSSSPDGEVVRRASSIGIALSTGGAERPEDLIRDADAAMYRAKERGQGARCELFDDDMRRGAARAAGARRARCAARSTATSCGVHYQPDGRPRAPAASCGFEALVRWEHPERGLLAPGAVHPARRGDRADRAASAAGCSSEACRQLGRWQSRTTRADARR